MHQVLAHEVIGHYGIDAFLDKEFGAILQQIPKIAKAPKNAHITGKEKPGVAEYARH